MALKLPDDSRLAGKMLESHARQQDRKLEMGWFGRAFGNAAEKPGNIAGAAVLLGFVIILVALSVEEPLRDKFVQLGGGIITLALGYLFGVNSKSGGG